MTGLIKAGVSGFCGEHTTMGKTVLYIAASVDGFVAGKNDDLSWLDAFNDVDYGFDDFFATIGAIIVGRRTYDIELAHGWATPHPVPTFVLTNRIPNRKPQRRDVIFTSEDPADVLGKAKQLSHKDVWIEGGAVVARQFVERDLLDDIILSIVPVILGGGVRLFADIGKKRQLALREVKQFSKGLVQLRYGRI